MNDNHLIIKENLFQTEANYLAFFQSLVQFLTYYFEELHIDSITDQKRYIVEKHILSSLFLIEKMHMHILSSQSFFTRNHDSSTENVFVDNAHVIAAFQSFHKFKKRIKGYNFLNENDTQQCERILAQILNYYPGYLGQIRFMKDNTPPSPWRPIRIRAKEITVRRK